ncbi:helix-turn-helix domain-containing protein [Acinetobacter beijerinckii]|uniref:helix-turn-helix domain-containing protein n=1 Tax=Acinetobacter beijerinckii TaxID=262668 RepID=UPI0023DDE5EE|nr:helix-turn-helix domain-containing protein [Acinetobacter beijerinckii]MDF2417273.1 helix-turn-helix domain-containing protein [Acinetobacter beijerinckii]
MSLDATVWAWKKQFTQVKGGPSPALKKLVLLSMADRADEQHCCYPSTGRLAEDCQINKKTLFKILEELISDGVIFDTGERKGRTKQVIVYRLIGVQGREQIVPTLEHFEDESIDTQGLNSETVPTLEQFQHFPGTVPTFPVNSTNIGTRNLSKNLSIESKNKKHWLCSKKLSDEIAQANPEIDPNKIISASWFNREFRAFEKFNAEKSMCDELMIYHFANWLLEAKAKLDRMNCSAQPSKKKESKPDNTLTEKQIKFLAGKLSRLPDFGKYALGNESHDQLAVRLETMLKDPKNIQKWAEHLAAVGFEQRGNAA